MLNPIVVFSEEPSTLKISKEDSVEAWEKREKLELQPSFNYRSFLWTHNIFEETQPKPEVEVSIDLIKKLNAKGLIKDLKGRKALLHEFEIAERVDYTKKLKRYS